MCNMSKVSFTTDEVHKNSLDMMRFKHNEVNFEVMCKIHQNCLTSNACQHCVALTPSSLSGFSGSGHDLDSCILIH